MYHRLFTNVQTKIIVLFALTRVWIVKLPKITFQLHIIQTKLPHRITIQNFHNFFQNSHWEWHISIPCMHKMDYPKVIFGSQSGIMVSNVVYIGFAILLQGHAPKDLLFSLTRDTSHTSTYTLPIESIKPVGLNIL